MMARAYRVALCLAAIAVVTACTSREPTPRLHTVAIRNLAFAPESLEVAVGDTVVWTNYDILPHTVTSDSRAWDSGNLAASDEWQLIVRDPGTQSYTCTFHPNMRGTLVARGS